MTQTQPPPAPPQGIAATPVTLTSGVLATIAFPTQAGGAPSPWRTPWLVILNSSPFTLLVTSGGQTTQIAAFTSDKVFAYSAGPQLPVTVLPIASALVPTGGQDSTAYATWYAQDPGNTYPAALGSGSANFNSPSLIIPSQVFTVNSGANNTIFNGSTSGFGGVAIAAREISGNGPVRLALQWNDSGGISIHSKLVVIPASGLVNFTLPNFGLTLVIRLANATATNQQVSMNASLMSLPLASFTTGDTAVGQPVQGLLFQVTGTAVAAGATTVIASSVYVYAGPVSLYLFLPMMTFDAHLQLQRYDGTWSDLNEWDQGSIPSNGKTLPLVVPANPLRLQVHNATLASATCKASLQADDFRIGA